MTKKTDILKTATILFAAKGYHNTSMSEVSKIAGVSGATIFYHYKNKEELLIAAIESVQNGIIDKFETYIEENEFESGLAMMEGLISFYLFLSGSEEEWFLLLHNHYPYLLAKDNESCRISLEKIYSCILDFFENAIVIGKQDGSIKISEPRKTALVIYSMIDGAVRFKIYDLYNVGAIYQQLMNSCTRILLGIEQKTR